MTGKEIMRMWLEDNIDSEVSYHRIQNELTGYAGQFGVYHTPDTWTRYFRLVRDEFDLEEVPHRKWKTWQKKSSSGQ